MKYIVLTIDCISSKKVLDVTTHLELCANNLNNNSLRNEDFITDFHVRVGDEVQGVIRYNNDFVKKIRYVREAFYPLKVRIGIGIGYIDNELSLKYRDPWKLNGSAFHNARESIKYLSNHSLYSKKPLSYLISDDREFDNLINMQLLLYDTILSKWSEKTYEAVYLKEKYGSFRNLDNYNEISYSAYTKRANVGNWSVLEDFEKNSSHIIARYISRT